MNDKEKNAFHAMEELLLMSKVRVTKGTLKEKLEQHPDFPSLSSLCDTLSELKIANLAANLPSERLSEIPLPAVAYLNIDGGIFAPIRAISDRSVEWLHTKKGWQYESKADFSARWNGVTLLIEPDNQSGEANFKKKHKQEVVESFRYPSAVVGCLLCLSLLITLSFQHFPLQTNRILYSLFSIKMAGFGVSSLLVWYSIDSSNAFLRKICQLNSNTNCRNILSSKAAKLFDWLSWAEIGLIYFFGGLITLLLSTIIQSVSVIPYLIILNCLALPYTLYSIYYQAFVAREWCLLCTLIQGLVWIEFAIGLHLWPPKVILFSWETTCILCFSFLIISSLWLLIKPLLQKSSKTYWLSKELNKLKFDSYYVRGLLDRQRVLPPIFEGMKVATIGNPDAEHTLIMVTNPSCESCASIHQEIEALLESTINIKCHFIIVASHTPNDEGGMVARKILSQPTIEMSAALHNWFTDPNLKRWLKKSINSEDMGEGRNQLNLHVRWCELAKVSNTPFIFFNNIELPRHFTISELEKLMRVFVHNGFENQII